MKTLRELTYIGARAADNTLLGNGDSSGAIVVNDLHGEYANDRPAREAFAKAIVEEAESEAKQELAELTERYMEMCGLLQNCVQTYQIGLGGEKIDKLVVDEVARLTAELAKRDERLAAMLADLKLCYQCFLDQHSHKKRVSFSEGIALGRRLAEYFMEQPAPTPEEIERREFEEMIAACVPGGQTCDPQVVADNLRAWQAARAGKEGK